MANIHPIYYYVYGDGFKYINLGNIIENDSDYSIVYNITNKKITTISSHIAESCIVIDAIDDTTLLMDCLDQNLGYILSSKEDLKFYLNDPDVCKYKLKEFLAPIMIRSWSIEELSELVYFLKSDPIEISNINFLENVIKQI